jgi:hypothetical protein
VSESQLYDPSGSREPIFLFEKDANGKVYRTGVNPKARDLVNAPKI